MKKLLSIVTAVLLLTGCSSSETNMPSVAEASTKNARFVSKTFYEHFNSEVHTLTDTETGCKYLIASQFQAGFGTAMTPLLKSDGTPDCEQANSGDAEKDVQNEG